MEVSSLPLDKLVQTNINPTERKIEIFASLMREFGLDYFPPICCKYSIAQDRYFVVDGTHTSLSAIRVGYTHILSEVIVVDFVDSSQLLS